MTLRASMMIFLVAGVGAQCARPVRTGPLIQRYSAAACVPVRLRTGIGPPTRTWDATLNIREGLDVHVSGAQMPGGRIDLKYSDGRHDVTADAGDYIYPADVRVEQSGQRLYAKASGIRATGGAQETWLFEYNLLQRHPTERLRVDPSVLPMQCLEVR